MSLEKYIIKFIFKWEEHKPSTYRIERNPVHTELNEIEKLQNKSNQTQYIDWFTKQNNSETHKSQPTSETPISYTDTKG